MVAAIADTTADIEERYAPNSLNAILLTPDKLYAISWHDPARVPAPQLRARGYADRPDEIACYFDLAYRADRGLGGGGQLGLADAGLDAAAAPPRPGGTTGPRCTRPCFRWRPPARVWRVCSGAAAGAPNRRAATGAATGGA